MQGSRSRKRPFLNPKSSVCFSLYSTSLEKNALKAANPFFGKHYSSFSANLTLRAPNHPYFFSIHLFPPLVNIFRGILLQKSLPYTQTFPLSTVWYKLYYYRREARGEKRPFFWALFLRYLVISLLREQSISGAREIIFFNHSDSECIWSYHGFFFWENILLFEKPIVLRTQNFWFCQFSVRVPSLFLNTERFFAWQY